MYTHLGNLQAPDSHLQARDCNLQAPESKPRGSRFKTRLSPRDWGGELAGREPPRKASPPEVVLPTCAGGRLETPQKQGNSWRRFTWSQARTLCSEGLKPTFFPGGGGRVGGRDGGGMAIGLVEEAESQEAEEEAETVPYSDTVIE